MREMYLGNNHRNTWIVRIAILFILILLLSNCNTLNKTEFDPLRAYDYIKYQTNLGPRTIGSSAHQQVIDWAANELEEAGWKVTQQTFERNKHWLTNIIASSGTGHPWIILGAHYDSRFFADQDPDPSMRKNPVPGANDGASGVAVLLEIAHSIPQDLNKTIWIVLFDAEDNGNIPSWDWIIGSREFVASLQEFPDYTLVIDMVGDADLDIYWEVNSSKELNNQIWRIAGEMGYPQFIPAYRHQILDDHIPFLEVGIPAVDIIDFDYPYWHTTQDTIDKISPESLNAVGKVLLEWLLR